MKQQEECIVVGEEATTFSVIIPRQAVGHRSGGKDRLHRSLSLNL